MKSLSLLTPLGIAALLAAFHTGCGSHAATASTVKAQIGARPTTLPGRIQAEDFNAAVDMTKENYGTNCDATNNASVDLQVAQDEGGGCAVGWTQDGEYLDYYVLNRGGAEARYDIEMRIASGNPASSITVESPPGTALGRVTVIENNVAPGWHAYATKKIENVALKPGLQIIRVKFTSESNFNYMDIKARTTLNASSDLATAEADLLRSCAGCHAFFKEGDKLSWTEIAERATSIKQRMNDPVSPMPPKGVGAQLQISEAQKNLILSQISGVADFPAPQASPLSTRKFSSRGMDLQRDLMVERVGHVWGMAFLPDGNILMTIKSGGVKLFNVKSRSVTDIPGAPASSDYGQGGLLDIALSSDFGDDRKVFMSYTKNVGGDQYTTALAAATFDGQRLVGTKDIFVSKGSNSKGEHFGGRIVIDDDKIWLSVGERNDRTNAQRLDNHLGKIMRLTLEGKAYPGNPFASGGGLAEIYSYGHRNPQGLAKNLLTGEIWEQEHGPKGGDEINLIKPGVNYGWPLATYGTEYSGDYLAPTHADGTEQPMTYWAPSIAPSGLVVYSSDLLAGWKGLSISGALAGQHLNLTEIKGGKKVSEDRLFGDDGYRIREVEQSPDGELWYATDAGHVFRIRRAQ